MVSLNQTTYDYVVLEFCHGTTLRSLLKNVGPSVRDARQIMIEASMALDYLSKLKPALVHRDFRSANMMWMNAEDETSAFRLKVLDLGLMLPHTLIMSDDAGLSNSICATQYNYWIPNEAIATKERKGKNFIFGKSSAFDVFSLGTLAYEIAEPNRGEDFRVNVVDKAHPCHFKTRSFWMALGLDKNVLNGMISENWKCRPRPCRVYSALTESPKLLVTFNEPMSKDHLACCKFIGSLAMVVNLADTAKIAKVLAACPVWIVNSIVSIELAIKQLINLAFRAEKIAEKGLPSRAFVELVRQIRIAGEADAEKAKLSCELEGVKNTFIALIEETKSKGRFLTDEQEETFLNKKKQLQVAVDDIFACRRELMQPEESKDQSTKSQKKRGRSPSVQNLLKRRKFVGDENQQQNTAEVPAQEPAAIIPAKEASVELQQHVDTPKISKKRTLPNSPAPKCRLVEVTQETRATSSNCAFTSGKSDAAVRDRAGSPVVEKRPGAVSPATMRCLYEALMKPIKFERQLIRAHLRRDGYSPNTVIRSCGISNAQEPTKLREKQETHEDAEIAARWDGLRQKNREDAKFLDEARNLRNDIRRLPKEETPERRRWLNLQLEMGACYEIAPPKRINAD